MQPRVILQPGDQVLKQGQYLVPADALRLSEDTERLRSAYAILRQVDPDSIGKYAEREDLRADLALMRQKFQRWISFAERKMATEYLSEPPWKK